MIRLPASKWIGTCAILVTGFFLAPPVLAATPQQVEQAIAKGQKWLLDARNKDGTWEEVVKPELSTDKDNRITDVRARQWGGLTSLATYALLASGEDRRSQNMKRPISFLLTANIQSTYGLGLSSQIALFIPEKESRDFVKRNVAMIFAGMDAPPTIQLRQPQSWAPGAGFYSYWTGMPLGSNVPEFGKQLSVNAIGTHQPPNWYDRSNSQYAVLGMWALADAGGEIKTLYWQIEDAAWKKAQLRDGGWNYNGEEEHRDATHSMTAAGIATLFLTQDFTLDENWSVCKGGVKNDYIERGLHWMDQHIDQALVGNYYTMYGIERIGTASGRKYFGTKDWYKIGADYIVSHQNADGSWSGSHGPLPDTSFSLLFLSRGRAPVMMNKLQYSSDKGEKSVSDPWNERPRDVANLAKWAGRQDESYFNWQVVNLNVAPEELHDAPILYISGSQPLNFSKEEEDKLRTYVQQGGMILGNADCGKEIFAKSFMALGRKLFPKYEFHLTGPNDFIFNEQFKDLRLKPKIMELTNNVRKLMVLVPEADLSRAWQTHSSKNEGFFGLGANIFLYAVDKKNLMSKDATYIVLPDPAIQAVGTIKVARVDVGDNADPEPLAWQRIANVMHNEYKIDLKVDLVKVDALSGYQVCDLTGTGQFTFTPATRASLKQFVEGGGTLIVDAAGGDVVFADSAENELATMFGGKPELLPENHLVYNNPTHKIDKIGWRDYAVGKVADKRHPKLRGIPTGKRTGVFFSREDLTAGMVGEPVDGIYGYDPETATKLTAGMLLYVQTSGNPPPPVAPPKAAAAQ
jgi:hypothetical protein